MDEQNEPYEPNLTAEQVERLRRWHESAYEGLRLAPRREMSYLGLELVVPAGVFAPTPTSDVLGQAVLDEVRVGDRVLDMGTGSGVNAILAAARSTDVVAVDINPAAVEAAIANADRNAVSERCSFVVGDLFDPVDGTFDLVVYDPPFRWFRPRDAMEAAMADEGYGSLRRFFAELPGRLNRGGRALVFFGTSGDMAYLEALIAGAGMNSQVVAGRSLTKEDLTVGYRTMRLTLVVQPN